MKLQRGNERKLVYFIVKILFSFQTGKYRMHRAHFNFLINTRTRLKIS